MNFQCTSDTVPDGYVADNGRLHGLHDNGLVYGWDCDLTETSGNTGCRDRGTDYFGEGCGGYSYCDTSSYMPLSGQFAYVAPWDACCECQAY